MKIGSTYFNKPFRQVDFLKLFIFLFSFDENLLNVFADLLRYTIRLHFR